jgi:hypothetical protein
MPILTLRNQTSNHGNRELEHEREHPDKTQTQHLGVTDGGNHAIDV